MFKKILTTAIICSFGALAGAAASEDSHFKAMHSHGHHDHGDTAKHAVAAASPAQELCPVMKGPINKEIYVDHQGKRVFFCCAECKDKFNLNPEMYLAAMAGDTTKPKAPAKALAPQKTCPIQGGPVNKKQFADVNGKRIYVCCEGCIAKVKADPQAALMKLEALGEAPEVVPSK